MRRQADVQQRRSRPGRGRVILVVAALVLFVLLTSLQGLATFYTDYLWFDELGFASVWRGVVGTKLLLAAIFTVGFFLLMWGNLRIADHLAPRFRMFGGADDDVAARYREAVGPHAGKVRFAVAAVFAFIAGAGTVGQWENWLLFRNGVEFGVDDAQFGRDLGFFVFTLPFLSEVVDWVFVALILVLLLTVVAHYLNGGIRPQAPGNRVTPQVKAHVSVLLALLAAVKGVDYWLSRYELVFSSRGPVDGATYTDVNAQLPALNLLVVISAAAVVLFLANIWMRGWVLPGIAVALWALVGVAVGTLYPAYVQNFQVNPDEPAKEEPYIKRNIEATRAALGIDGVTERSFDNAQELTAADLVENAETIRNIRLWDPPILVDTYQRLQEVRDFFQFNDVDVDRYLINGEMTQTVLSARELDPDGLPSQRKSWVNKHLQFTHGYGAVLSPANAVTTEGQPDFLVRNVPPEVGPGGPEITQPEIYFGEDLGGYAVVNTTQGEVDYITADGTDRTSNYRGDGGVALESPLRRAALALRMREMNLLISDSVKPSSRVVFRRDIRERVETAAPFLKADADPYPVIIEGRIKWVLDTYTVTNRYPYGETADTDNLPASSGLRGVDFNYVRNSVKAVVDAYDGTVTLYIVDDGDPIVQAWAKAFPELFTSGDEVSDDLRAHFRYPEDLFRVQAGAFGDYHIENPLDFYRKSDSWQISQDPGSGRVSPGGNEDPQETPATTVLPGGVQLAVQQRETRMDPYYLLMRLPEAEREEFLILQPFVPTSRDDSRKEMTAFLVAKSDPENYGDLEVFVMPRDNLPDGPPIVAARIFQEPEISEQITLLSRAESQVLLGNLLVIPIEDSLLHVRPLYVQAEGTKVPEFKFAIVVYREQVVMRPTLQEALTVIFGDAPETLEEGPSGTPVAPSVPGEGAPPAGGGALSPSVQALLDQAAAAFEAADAALREGDLATYQAKFKEAQGLVARAREESRAASPGTTTTTAPATET